LLKEAIPANENTKRYFKMRILNLASRAIAAHSKVATMILAGAVAASSGVSANALTYSTSGAPTQLSLGDTIGSLYDQLNIQGATGTIDSNTTSIVLNTLTFIAGINATVPATYNNQFSFSENVTIDTGSGGPSGSGVLTVPFNLAISYSDTLTVIGGTKISIPVGSNIWSIVVNALTIGPNPGGPMTAFLTAQVSDPPAATPLPAAFWLFGSGLGVIELLRRRRKAHAAPLPLRDLIALAAFRVVRSSRWRVTHYDTSLGSKLNKGLSAVLRP
jgi:hypothetical protein